VKAPLGFQGVYQRVARDPARPEVLSDLLALIGYDAAPEDIERWTTERRVEAEVHAVNVHLRAQENRLRAHPRPAWMPEPWQGQNVGEGVFAGPAGSKVA
jgi:hypothetical protein